MANYDPPPVPGMRAREFKKKVTEIVKANCARLKCPFCKNKTPQWIGERLIGLIGTLVVEDEYTGNLKLGSDGAAEYAVSLRCGECGHIALFSAAKAIEEARLEK
jgi:hypothetical protein